MAVYFYSPDPRKLLNAIRSAIDAEKIKTWSYDKDGDFTHTAEQWKYKAWLRPRVDEGVLRFYILAPKETTISKTVYAIYHGRFIESVLTHADDLFSKAEATALAVVSDRVKG